MGKKGRGHFGQWWSVEDQGSNRQMKYKHCSKMPHEWDLDPHLRKFLITMTNVVLGRYLGPDHTKYILGKYNLLRNGGMISDDQMPHRDYPPRLIQ